MADEVSGKPQLDLDFVYTQLHVVDGRPIPHTNVRRSCCACPNTCDGNSGGGCANDWFDAYKPHVPQSVAKGASRQCDGSCRYCRVEAGSDVDVCIFRTASTGWGVRANAPIARGQFVEGYSGELCPVNGTPPDEGSRDNWYVYCANIDADNMVAYEINARHFGNFTRFINHSCEPNLVSVKMFTEDEQFPHRVCFFAAADIAAAEELTLDYGYPVSDAGELLEPKLSRKCHCGTGSCRGYLIRC